MRTAVAVAAAASVLAMVPEAGLADERALRTLRALVERHPEDPDLRLALAEAQLAAGEPEQALRELEEVLRRWPERAGSFDTTLGTAHLRAGNAEAALAFLESAIAREPGNAVARSSYALALDRVGNPRDARRQVAFLARLDPSLAAETELLLGLYAQRDGRRDEARRRLNRAIELDPDGSVASRARQALSGSGAPGFEIGGRAGFEYDWNAAQESDVDLPGESGDSGDGRSALDATLAWQSPPVDRAGAMRVEVGYAVAQSLHLDLRELDRQLHTPFLGLSWPTGERSSLHLDGFFSHERLDRSGYRHGFGFQPSWSVDLSGALGVLRPFALYRNDDYLDRPERPSLDRDGNEWGGGLEHTWSLPWRAGGDLRSHLVFARVDTSGRRDADGFAPAYDRDEWSGGLDAWVPLMAGFRLSASAWLVQERYEHRNVVDAATRPDPDSAARRRDLAAYTWLGVSRPVGRFLELQVGWGYRERDSNVDAFSTGGHVVGFYTHLRGFQPSLSWGGSE